MLGRLDVKIGADITSLTGQLKKAQASLSNFSAQTGKIGRNLSASITAPLALLGGTAIKTAAEFEDLRTSFEVMTGSAEKGAEVFERLRAFAASTPFETAQLAKATQTMLSFGFTVEDSADTLRMLGDVAMGNGQKLDTLTLAFSRIVSNGKAMGQEINMMIDQGFNPLQILSEKTGKSMSVLKDEMAKGAITADMIRDAFATATSQGGQFFGGMEKGSQTLSGVFSTFRDNVNSALATIGEELVKTLDLKELVKDFTKRIQQFIEVFQNLSDEAKKNILAIVAIMGASGPLLLAISALGVAISGLGTIIAFLTGPIGLTIGAIAALAAAFTYVAVNYEALKERFTDISWWKNALINMLQFFAEYNPFALIIKGINSILEFAGREGIGNPFERMTEGLEKFKTETKEYENQIVPFSTIISNALESAKNSFFEAAKSVRQSVKVISSDVKLGLSEIQAVSLTTNAIVKEGLSGTVEQFKVAVTEIPKIVTEQFMTMEQAQKLLTDITTTFTNSFGQGMANVIVQGERLIDTLKNIGKLLASAAIQKAISVLLTGGLGGAGFFGQGGGIFGTALGKLTGKAVGGPVFSNTPYIVGERGPELFMPNRSGSIVPNGQLMGKGAAMGTQDIKLGGEFRIKGTDLVLTLNEANYRLGR